MNKSSILLTLILGLCLQTAMGATKVFPGYRLAARDAGDAMWPVVGMGEKSPLIITDKGVIESGRNYIKVSPRQTISDQGIEILSMETSRRNNLLVLELELKSTEAMEGAYAILTYPREDKPEITVAKIAAVQPLTGEVQRTTVQFRGKDIPEEGWSLNFFKGDLQLYTNQTKEMRDASVEEAFILNMARHLAGAGAGNANPAPFYMPIEKPDPSLLPEGDAPYTVKVKLKIQKNGRVKEFTFVEEIDPELEAHLSGTIRNWLFLPRVENGKAVDKEVVLPLQLRL